MKNGQRYQSFLATSSRKFLKVGFIVSIGIVIIAFKLPIYGNTETEKINYESNIEFEKAVDFLNHSTKKEVPPVKEIKEFKQNSIIKTDEEVFEKLAPIKVNKKIEEENFKVPTEIIKDKSGEKEIDPVFDIVSKMPEYPGGEIELLKYLAGTKYNEYARDENIEGTVYIRFIVDKEGNITEEEIYRGVHPWLDKEALKMIKKMPKWTPGLQNGRRVKVRITIPFDFTLE